jgi:hypothetical protein
MQGRGEKGGATLFCPTHPRSLKAGGDTAGGDTRLTLVGDVGELRRVARLNVWLSTFSVWQHEHAWTVWEVRRASNAE